MNFKQWTTKDFILVGVLSVVFSMVFAVAGIATVLFGGITHVFAPAIAGLLGGVVFLLILVKVPKFGVFTLSSLILLIIMYLTGHAFLPLLLSIFFAAIVADLVCLPSAYKNIYALATGFVVFINGQMFGTIIPILFFLDDYKTYSAEKASKTSEQIINFITPTTALILIAITSIAALLGFLIGRGLLRKHFVKAGKI